MQNSPLFHRISAGKIFRGGTKLSGKNWDWWDGKPWIFQRNSRCRSRVPRFCAPSTARTFSDDPGSRRIAAASPVLRRIPVSRPMRHLSWWKFAKRVGYLERRCDLLFGWWNTVQLPSSFLLETSRPSYHNFHNYTWWKNIRLTFRCSSTLTSREAKYLVHQSSDSSSSLVRNSFFSFFLFAWIRWAKKCFKQRKIFLIHEILSPIFL